MKAIRPFSVVLLFGVCACADTPPNFLVFLADDCSYHDIGCYGNDQVKTPYIDGLAKEGMRFAYSFNSAPMCAPTRMSLYTGIHPVRNGAHPNHSQVYEHIQSIPHYFQPLGYTVALTGKRHFGAQNNFPFEEFDGKKLDDKSKPVLDPNTIDRFISDNKGNPWFLVVASNQPHGPWNLGDASAYVATELNLPPYLVDTPETRRALKAYYAEITYMDGQVGACLDSLKKHGLEENTVVVFLSEQGSSFPFCKWTCYEAGLRSAQVVRWPENVKAGSTTNAIVQYVDLLPTCFELAGGDPEAFDFDGRSFSPVLRGEKTTHHDVAFGIQTSRGIMNGPDAYGIRTVRNKRFRLIWNLNSDHRFQNAITENADFYHSWKKLGEQGDDFALKQFERYQVRSEYELYDLQNDPYEMTNLANEPAYASNVAALKSKLESWMQQQGDEGALTEMRALERMCKQRQEKMSQKK